MTWNADTLWSPYLGGRTASTALADNAQSADLRPCDNVSTVRTAETVLSSPCRNCEQSRCRQSQQLGRIRSWAQVNGAHDSGCCMVAVGSDFE
jgi:hypothetical protein